MALAVALAVAGGSAHARDFNKLLQGDYLITGGSAACMNSALGFTKDPDLQPIFGPGGGTSMFSFNVSGVRTFNGDGTGTLKARNVSLGHPPSSNVGASDVVAEFAYDVAPDLTITIKTTKMTTTQLVGPRRGVVNTVEGVPPLVGTVSEDLSTITVAHVYPQVETTRSKEFGEQQRICYRDRIMVRPTRH